MGNNSLTAGGVLVDAEQPDRQDAPHVFILTLNAGIAFIAQSADAWPRVPTCALP